MKRTIPIIGIILLLALSGIPTILSFDSYNINQIENNDDIDWWPTFHHDAQNTGYSTSKAPNNSNICWTYQIDEFTDSSPIIYNGKVFMTTSDSLLCLDLYSGEKVWENTGIYFNFYISSPAIYENKLFLSCNKGGHFGLHCFNPDNGSLIWSNRSLSDYGFSGHSSPVIYNDNIYLGINNVYDAYHKPDDCIFCIDVDNGEEIWRYRFEGNIESTPALVNDKLYFGGLNGIVYCLNAKDGSEIWKYNTNTWLASPAISDNKVFIANFFELFCLNGDTSEKIWSFEPSYSFENTPPADPMISSPAIADGRVCIGSIGWNKNVWCLNATTGETIWKYSPPSYPVQSSPAVADGKVYFSLAFDPYVPFGTCCLDANNGDLIWIDNRCGAYYSSPAIADGKIIIISGNKKIFCIGEPPELEIGYVFTDGLALNIVVRNKADSCAAIDVNCNVSIKGGLGNNINLSINKTIDYLYRNEEIIFNFKNSIKSDLFIFGLGFIDITIQLTSDNAENVLKTMKGFIVGPFLFLKKY
ncbi:MAG: PQQ-binding-like beta-propeller repeat protein [Candidatus Thermoplasmatota archaeon]|nr:PQQ-binding-like beta-propeller repeat protein [Candidatus Thermoplasmatota archaeon]